MTTFKTKILFLLFLYIVSVVSHKIRSYAFRLTQTKGEPFSSLPLYTFSGSLRACAFSCTKYRKCKGFRYMASGTCLVLGPKNQSLDSELRLPEESNLYTIHQTRKTFGDACLDTPECNYHHRMCLRGACSCDVGFSYDFGSDECVTRCSHYGGRFSVYNATSLKGTNTAVAFPFTAETCLKKCRDESKWLCVSCEFNQKSRVCHTCNVTWSSVAEEKKEIGTATNWLFFYRHCGH